MTDLRDDEARCVASNAAGEAAPLAGERAAIRRGRAAGLSSRLRLGPHEFAYLRAVSQGLDAVDASRRYLGLEHAAQLAGLHRRLVERAQAIARRRSDVRWRLLGARIPTSSPAATRVPSVEAWAEAEGLSDYAWDELLALHAERFDADGAAADDPRAERRRQRNARLMARRLDLLADLQRADPAPQPGDSVDGWLPPALAKPLVAAGIATLAELRAHILRGGRWWRMLPAHGRLKADRLAAHVQSLLGPPELVDAGEWHLPTALEALRRLETVTGPNRVLADGSSLSATTDRAAIAAWIAAQAGSHATAAAYAREAERFVMWAATKRHVGLGSITVGDCRAYADFLADVPGDWIRRIGAPRLGAGWTPFRGQLSLASQRQAVAIVHALFAWLVAAGYLQRNPWTSVNRRAGDDVHATNAPITRAFTPTAWAALLAQLQEDAAVRPQAAARLRWLLVFVEATGLRASEVLNATREELRPMAGTWVLSVLGRGRTRREVVVPQVALQATRAYFAARGLDFGSAAPGTYLLGSLTRSDRTAATDLRPEPGRPAGAVAYSSLRRAMAGLAARAARRLDADEQRALRRASLHWLRHTFAARATDRGVAASDVREQLGNVDPRAAARAGRPCLHHRAMLLERAWAQEAQRQAHAPDRGRMPSTDAIDARAAGIGLPRTDSVGSNAAVGVDPVAWPGSSSA